MIRVPLRKFRDQFDLGHDFPYGAFDRAETELVGSSGLHTRLGPGAREIGYWVHAAHTGKGPGDRDCRRADPRRLRGRAAPPDRDPLRAGYPD